MLGAVVGIVGCTEMQEDVEASHGFAVTSSNGLTSVNGLSLVNGLYDTNGLSLVNGLSSDRVEIREEPLGQSRLAEIVGWRTASLGHARRRQAPC